MAKQINKPAKSDATKGFFEIANANFNKDELLSYTITEMDDTVVYYKPLTFGEQQEIFVKSKKDEFASLLYCFMIKVLDSDGKRMFDLTHEQKIRTEVPPLAVIETANEILQQLGK